MCLSIFSPEGGDTEGKDGDYILLLQSGDFGSRIMRLTMVGIFNGVRILNTEHL